MSKHHQGASVSRRTAIAGAVAAITPLRRLVAATPARGAAARLILLGTAGGPRPRKARSGSAQVIIVGQRAYVVDCGYGVARQLVLAGIPLRQLRHIFITHHHSDHNIDLGPLVQLAWMSGLTTPVDCWGPPPISQMIRDYLRYQQADIDVRVADESRLPLAPLIKTHEIRGGGPVVDDGEVKVTSAVVPHPPLDMALAYRFDTPGRSIVISGDTKESEEVVKLARGADVLVHEVMLADRVAQMLKALPNRVQLARSVVSHHTSAEQVGRVAAAAGVKTLVLSHFVPADDPDIPDDEWLAPVRRHFTGRVIVGRDLMEI